MNVQMMTIGPAQAKGLLAANSKNRPISKTAVSALANAIRRGEWVPNGATIVIGTDGVLLDGQHRLSAVVESGIPVQSLLVTGADPRTFMTIDVGGKGHRKNTDLLALAGEKNAPHLQSAVNWVERYYTGTVLSQSTRLSPQQTADALARNPGIRDVVNAFRSAAYSRICGASAIAFHYLAGTVDRHAADGFMHDIGVGAGLAESDPALVARNILIGARGNGNGVDNAMRTFLTLVRAWNFRRDGRPASPHSIKVRLTGDRRTPDLDISGLPRVHVEAAAE